VTVNQKFPVTDRWSGFVQAQESYVGEHVGLFPATAATPRQSYGGYGRLNLLAGIKQESWTINLFANNVTDKRGLVEGGPDNAPSYAYTYIPPRTIGASVIKAF